MPAGESFKSDPIPTAAPWPTVMKSPPNEGDELMEMNNKPGLETKKNPCICSPTSHAGSFRCHLHRATGTAASKPQEPSLSRFGRAGVKSPSFRSSSVHAAIINQCRNASKIRGLELGFLRCKWSGVFRPLLTQNWTNH
ncbi:hypothetical protein V6N13_128072 [Hibiscus sabdariffa]